MHNILALLMICALMQKQNGITGKNKIKENKMSMKYDYLEELKNDFINALQDAVKHANNESDMDALDGIAEDAICEIPVELMQKDYWMRSAIIGRLPKKKQQDTKFINGLMRYIYNEDAVYMGDYVVENIDECIDEYVEQENKKGE